MIAFAVRRFAGGRPGAVRDQRAGVPDLLRHPGRRPGGAHRRPQRRPGDARAGAARLRPRPAAAGALRADDEAPASSSRDLDVLRQPRLEGRPADHRTPCRSRCPSCSARPSSGWWSASPWARPRRRPARHARGPADHDARASSASRCRCTGSARSSTCITQSRLHDRLFSWVPPLGYVGLDRDPVPVGAAPALPLADAGRPVRRDLRPACCARAGRPHSTRTTCAPPAPRGSPSGAILVRHALRCSLIPFVSLFGLDFGALVGGARPAHRGGLRPARGRQAHLRRARRTSTCR